MSRCIVYFGDNKPLKQSIISITHPSPTDISILESVTNIMVSKNGGVESWMDDNGSYYKITFQELPYFCASTQMAEFRAFIGLEPENKFMTNCIIKTNNSLEQGNAVIKLAIKAGFNNIINSGPFSSIVCGQWRESGGQKQLLQGDYEYNIESKPHWPRLDAATDMDKIKLFFAGKLELPVIIENFVMPKLLEMIQNNPFDELTSGFIRRDLKLALPPEVQAQGTDSICAWILEQKKSEQPTVSAGAHAPKTNKFKISLYLNSMGSWSRNDTVDFEGTVPQEVVDGAIAENDYEIIEGWMIANRGSLHEINREYGDQRDSESENEGYDGVSEEGHSIEEQFNDMISN